MPRPRRTTRTCACRPQAVQVHGQQFHRVVRTLQRAVDPGTCPPGHPPLAAALGEDQQLRLPPLDADLAAVLHALAFLGLDLSADADPAAIDLGDDMPAGQLVAGREQAVTKALQVTSPCRQDLGPQLAGHAVDGLLVEPRPPAAEFLASQFDRGEQGTQAAHPALQRRGRPLADAQGGQFGVAPSPLTAPALGTACLGAARDRGDPEDQTAQQTELQPPRLRGAS